jgi:hypothetical protein
MGERQELQHQGDCPYSSSPGTLPPSPPSHTPSIRWPMPSQTPCFLSLQLPDNGLTVSVICPAPCDPALCQQLCLRTGGWLTRYRHNSPMYWNTVTLCCWQSSQNWPAENLDFSTTVAPVRSAEGGRKEMRLRVQPYLPRHQPSLWCYSLRRTCWQTHTFSRPCWLPFLLMPFSCFSSPTIPSWYPGSQVPHPSLSASS